MCRGATREIRTFPTGASGRGPPQATRTRPAVASCVWAGSGSGSTHLAPMSLRAATHSRLCAKSSTPGESRVVAGCHFAVRLNHLIPGSRSYSVAVVLKWQSGITLGGGPSTRPSTTRCAGGTSRRKDIGVPHAAPLLGMNRGLARRRVRVASVCVAGAVAPKLFPVLRRPLCRTPVAKLRPVGLL